MGMDQVSEIRKLLSSEKLVLGTERTMKKLKSGKLKKIYVSANCPSKIKETIKHYSELGKIEVIKLEQQNDELGIVCRKPFSVSMIGLEE